MSAPQPPNTKIPFTKASACGNDFLLVEGAHFSGDLSALTRRMCDRHRGVGADGVEWLFPDAEADVKARLINADGSEAEISGNGTRCVAAEICSRTKRQNGSCRAHRRRTEDLPPHFSQDGRQGSTFEFEAEMGQPELGGQLSIETGAVRTVGTKVSMGNPHYVIFVENFQEGWQRQAALIGTQPQFPQGTNVEYVVVRGANEIEIRLFERGVGETAVFGYGIVRVGGGGDCKRAGRFAGDGDCPRRSADGALGESSLSAGTGDSGLPRRILALAFGVRETRIRAC